MSLLAPQMFLTATTTTTTPATTHWLGPDPLYHTSPTTRTAPSRQVSLLSPPPRVNSVTPLCPLYWICLFERSCMISDWLILVSFKQNTNNQLFCNVKNMERERGRGLFGVESNATLPADWKHHEARKEPGLSFLLPVSNSARSSPTFILSHFITWYWFNTKTGYLSFMSLL